MRNRRTNLYRAIGTRTRREWSADYTRRHPRASSEARGYDADWRKLRAAQLAEEPNCRHCALRGIERRARVVDHIEPIRSAPERRLDPDNLQSLCFPCHNAKTAREDRGFGRDGSTGGASKNF